MKILSKSQEKLIRSLQHKKFRKEHNLFVVEGVKLVSEALVSDYELVHLVGTKTIAENYFPKTACTLVDDKVMKQLSSLITPPGVLAVLRQKEGFTSANSDLTLVLDRIKDPGNLGTIIRTADALGVAEIICSTDTVDCFSPKVLQASMGSIFRVQLRYLDLVKYIGTIKAEQPIYATHLQGEDIYQKKLNQPAVLIMGNESEGVSEDLMKMVTESLRIPIIGQAESFNVSIATAIVLAEFKRQFRAN